MLGCCCRNCHLQMLDTEFTRGWFGFGFWFKSESCRNLNLTSRAWVELFMTRALSHGHEVLQVSTPGEGLRRKFYLTQNLNQTLCELCVTHSGCCFASQILDLQAACN